MTISSCTKTKSFRSLDVQSRYSTRSVMILLKSPMKMHSSWSFDYERFHFASPEGFRGRRHKSHRPNHRPRTWTDIELLRINNLRVGVILNFKQPKMEWELIVVLIFVYFCL